MDQQISAEKEATMGGIISSTNDNNAKESSDTDKVSDAFTVLEEPSTSQTSDMDEELWLGEPTDVKVETDEDFDVIVKSLETAIVQTEIYDVPDPSADLIEDFTKELAPTLTEPLLGLNSDILSENILLDTILPDTNIAALQINDSPESPEKIESSDLIEPDEVQDIEDTLLSSSFEDIIPETPDPSEEPPEIILEMDIPENQKGTSPEINIDPEDEIIPETPEPTEEPEILDNASPLEHIEIPEINKNSEIPLNTPESSDESNILVPKSDHPEIHLKNIEIPELDKIPDLLLETLDKNPTKPPEKNQDNIPDIPNINKTPEVILQSIEHSLKTNTETLIPEIIDPPVLPLDPIEDNSEISGSSVKATKESDLSKSNLQAQIPLATDSAVATPEIEVEEQIQQENEASLQVEESRLKHVSEIKHASPDMVDTPVTASEEILKKTSEEMKIVAETKTVETETFVQETKAADITPEIIIITPQTTVTCPENKSQPVVIPPETKSSNPEIKPIIISPAIIPLPTEMPPENLSNVTPPEIKSHPIVTPAIEIKPADIPPVKQIRNPPDTDTHVTPPEIKSHPIVKPAIENKPTDISIVKQPIVNHPDTDTIVTPPEIKSHPIVKPAIENKPTDIPSVKQPIVNPPDTDTIITPPEIKSHPIVKPAIENKPTDISIVKQPIVNPPDTDTIVTPPEIKSHPIVKPAIENKPTDIPSVKQPIVNPPDTDTNVTPPEIKSHPIVKPAIEIKPTDIPSVKQTIANPSDTGTRSNITPPSIKIKPADIPPVKQTILNPPDTDTNVTPPEIKSQQIKVKPTDIPSVKQAIETPPDMKENITPPIPIVTPLAIEIKPTVKQTIETPIDMKTNITPPEIKSHPIVKSPTIEIKPTVKQTIDTKTDINPPEIKPHLILKPPAIEIKPTFVKQTIVNPATKSNITPAEMTPKPIEIPPAIKIKAADIPPVNPPETKSNVTPIEIKPIAILPEIKSQPKVITLEITASPETITQSSAIQQTSLETLPEKPSKIIESLPEKQTMEEILLELQTKEESLFEKEKPFNSSEYPERSSEKRSLETEDHTPPKKIKLVRQKLVKPTRKIELSIPPITKSVPIVKELLPPAEEEPKQRVVEVNPSPDLKELVTDSNLEQKDITSDEVASPENKSIKKGKVKLRRNYRPPDVANKSIPVDQKKKVVSHIQKQDIIPIPGNLKEQEPQDTENFKIAIIEKSKLAEESKIDKVLPAAVVPDIPEVLPIDSKIPEVLPVKSSIPETLPIDSKITKIPETIPIVSNIPAALSIKSNTPKVLPIESKVAEILPIESEIPEPLPVKSKVTDVLVETKYSEIISIASKMPEILPTIANTPEILPIESKHTDILTLETKMPEVRSIESKIANTSEILTIESKNTDILTLETKMPEVRSIESKITEVLVETKIPEIILIDSKIPEHLEENILEEPKVTGESPSLEDSNKEMEKNIKTIELNETFEKELTKQVEVVKITKNSVNVIKELEVRDTIISAELIEKSVQEIVENTEIPEDIDKILEETEDQNMTNTSSETEIILSGTSVSSEEDSTISEEMEPLNIQADTPEIDIPSPEPLKIEEEMEPLKIEEEITECEETPETTRSSEIVKADAFECKDTGLKLISEPDLSESKSINVQLREISQSIKAPEEILNIATLPQIIPQTSIRKSSKRKAEPIESIIKPLMVQVDDLESSSEEYEPKPSEYYPKIVIKPIPKPDQPRSPKITIKPIVKPPELILKELKLKEEASTPRITIKPVVKPDLKMTITKQKHDSHSILKIYKPGDDDYVPKLTIKPIPEPMQHSPRLTIKPVKASSPKVTVKPVLPPSDLQIIHSPKTKANHEESYPKVTIKPILRPEELSPRHMKMKGMSFEASSGITVEPIPSQSDTQINTPKISVKPFAKLEEALSPKLTIKPITKTCEIGYSEEGSTNPLKLTIKPIKSEESYQSPKITIKPILKMDEEEDKPERIILKIQKSNLPSPSGSREPYDSDKKLDKIKLKLTKEGSHAQIIPSGDQFNLKRSLHLENAGISEKRAKTEFIASELLHSSDISINLVSPNTKPNLKQFSEEVTIVKIEKPAPISQSAQLYKSKIKDMLLKIQQKPNITCTQIEKDDSSSSDDVKIVEIIDDPIDDPLLLHDESSSQDVMIVSETLNINPFQNVQIINTHSLSDSLIQSPKKRGRPRKNPLEVKPELKDEDCMEVVRPKRTCRAPPGRTPFAVKERKPRGARARGGSRGRGVGRGGIAGIAKEPKPLRGKALKQAKALAKLEAARLKQEVIIDEIIIEDSTNDTTPAATPIPPADESPKKLDLKDPEPDPIVVQLMIEPVEKIQQANDEPSFPQPVAVYEDETQMSADCNSRAQTPARQVVIAPEGPEESQSSIQSSATTESNKNKKGRLEVCDPDNAITLVDQIVEYSWSGGGPYMLQEQIAQYLGVKSFKRKYPGLTRRPVEMQERDYIREKGLVSESMCDMGLTAVPSSEILDIMYTDFQEKYEEYRKCLRDKQSKEITNKQKAISLATSQEKNKIDFKERAIRSAANWNLSFNKSRNDARKCCMDLQTFTINFPTGSCKVPQKAPVGNYPIALVPGQFTDYYKSYTTNDLKYLPLNSVKFGPVLPNQQSPDLSDGSLSDSDSSSGSDSDSSDDSMSSIEEPVVIVKPTSSLPSTPKARVH